MTGRLPTQPDDADSPRDGQLPTGEPGASGSVIRPISSPQSQRLRRLRSLLKPRDRRALGMLRAEGLREVSRALDAQLRLVDLFLAEHVLASPPAGLTELLAAGRACDGACLWRLPDGLLAQMAYRERPEGIIGVFASPAWTADALPSPATAPWLVVLSPDKPGNVGAMARTASAAGVGAMLVVGGGVDPFNPNAIRASTGAVFSLPILAMETEEALARLTAEGVRLIAADVPAVDRDDALRVIPYDRADYSGSIAIVIGAEDRGLDARWRAAAEACGLRVAIPMSTGVVDSLNASVAAGLILFEARRQRGDNAG